MVSELDDKIDQWHKSKSKKKLHEYLGWTWERYKNWAEGRTVTVIARRVAELGAALSFIEKEITVSTRTREEAEHEAECLFGKYENGDCNVIMIEDENGNTLDVWRAA